MTAEPMEKFCFCGVIENVKTLVAVCSCGGIHHINTVANEFAAEAMCDVVHIIKEPVFLIVDLSPTALFEPPMIALMGPLSRVVLLLRTG